MKITKLLPKKNESGAVAILIAVCLIVLIGFAALAFDIGHLYVVRNELQNAADAGALAGARMLHNSDGSINTDANWHAYEVAVEHVSENTAVDVNWVEGMNSQDECDVQRGHWSFQNQAFTPSDNTTATDLWNVTGEELDSDTNFVNAVRVRARRSDTPVASFFAKVFGHESFQMMSEAVAYIGFAGKVLPDEVDQPINICKQSIIYGNDQFTCTVGRMMPDPEETAGWTDFTQSETSGECPTGGAKGNLVKLAVDTGCDTGGANSMMLDFGNFISNNNGMIQSAYDAFMSCWLANVGEPPTVPWKITLPVVDCSYEDPTCQPLVGLVEINVVWIFREGPQYNDPEHQKNDDIIPWEMGDPNGEGGWSSTDPDASARWNSFADYFNLQTTDGLITWERLKEGNVAKTIFFLPDCTPHEPAGVSGGQNFGILAKIPVLVQ
ncbi:MAG: pilus assembly protein TadG-related protein [Dissulfuribacterales bacterium]